MVIASWLLRLENGELIQDPDWGQIQQALVRLDGRLVSMVSLEKIDKGCLLVGGGNQGRYIVVFFPGDSGRSLTLTDPSAEDYAMTLTVEGVESGPFPAKQCVTWPIMLRAIEHYFKIGRLSEVLTWDDGVGSGTR